MPDSPEKQWVKATANELNNLLQVISNSSQMLESLCPRSPETEKYFSILRSGVDRAAKVTQMMSDRMGGISPEPAAPHPADRLGPPANLVPLPLVPDIAGTGDVKIHNPTGSR